METILIVEDKKSMAQMLKESLESEGYRCVVAPDGEEAVSLIKAEFFDLIISDLKLPRKDGLEVLRTAQQEDPSLPVIIMTAFGTIETAVKAIKEGAFDFITKPFDTDHLLVLIRRALQQKRLFRENILLRQERSTKEGIPTIVGKSKVMTALIEKVKKVAPTRTTVLLLGESGTGKELFARAIHHLSPRAEAMFVPLNCAAIPRDLLESELFGHEKGAFTGATSRRLGKFELAHGGTIFLDEVAELELSLQAKLLRALQDQKIERVGGTKLIQVDVRVIAATNTDLARAV
ncbi:MAG: sigma-54-dependent Fis family transcriptional regulator, partial [Nitrospirae bacterium]